MHILSFQMFVQNWSSMLPTYHMQQQVNKTPDSHVILILTLVAYYDIYMTIQATLYIIAFHMMTERKWIDTNVSPLLKVTVGR